MCLPCCVLLQPDAAAQRGALQLFDSMQAQFSSQGGMGGAAASPAVVALPPGFLEELAAAQDAEALGTIMGPVGEWPADSVVWSCSRLCMSVDAEGGLLDYSTAAVQDAEAHGTIMGPVGE
jgi:hypothetical protein